MPPDVSDTATLLVPLNVALRCEVVVVPAMACVASMVTEPDFGHLSPCESGSTRSFTVVETLRMKGAPVRGSVPFTLSSDVPASVCTPLRRPLNVSSSFPVIATLVPFAAKPRSDEFMCTASVVSASNCDCGVPVASSSMNQRVKVTPDTDKVGQLKRCVPAL